MKVDKIIIAGQKVNICYSLATEIGYQIMANEDANDYFIETAERLSAEPTQAPDRRKSVYMILAAIAAWNDANDKETTITDKDIIHKTTPTELGLAIGKLFTLRGEFYKMPETMKEEDNGEDKEKNV